MQDVITTNDKYIVAIKYKRRRMLFTFRTKKDANSFIKDVEKTTPKVQYAIASIK